jgi:viroplasmin and RNaseH domain-containing protein
MIYKEFKSEEQADKWLDDNYWDWFKELSLKLNEEGSYQNALYGYGGSVFKHINELLRAIKGRRTIEEYLLNSSLEAEFEVSLKESLLINSTIDKVKINDNIVLYRYTKLIDVIRLIRGGSFRSIVEYGFMSTTMLPDNET